MIYCFDIDNTICITEGRAYDAAIPIDRAIRGVNKLYDEGHIIKMFTARGTTSKIDYTILTKKQLSEWGVLYHELIMNTKPSFDLMIDDRAINASDWIKTVDPKIGLIAGSFDLIHPGYIQMFKDAKNVCDHLIVALQDDPTIDRPKTKLKPVQSLNDRKIVLSSIRYVDEIKTYTTEEDLYRLLKETKHDVRILGSEYNGLEYNGQDLGIPVYYHVRDHRILQLH